MAALTERLEDLTNAVEIHHCTPQYLLRMRDRADEAVLDGAGIEAWLEYEAECSRAETSRCRETSLPSSAHTDEHGVTWWG